MAGVGRTLIGLGLLLLAFVAYQLWGTGLQQSRAQDRLSDRFAELSSSTRPPSTPEPSTDPGQPETGQPETGTVPTVISPGDPIGVIEIPRIGVRDFVVSGVSTEDLRKGPGHFPDTPLPGELGNSAIAGHRTTYGQPFAELDRLQSGDEIVMEMLGGGRYVYRVDSVRVVAPSDVSVVETEQPDVARITLTTCHPRWSASQRLIVSGVLDTRASGAPAKQPITVESSGSASSGVAGDSNSVTGTTNVEAFDSGWFADPAAWPHVIAWSLLVLAFVVATLRLARWSTSRSRSAGRRWPVIGGAIACAAGALPILVSLYFAFENLSRLLPTDL